MGTHALVTSCRSFLDIVDHAHSLNQIICEVQEGSDKQARREKEFSGSQIGFRVSRDRPLRRG